MKQCTECQADLYEDDDLFDEEGNEVPLPEGALLLDIAIECEAYEDTYICPDCDKKHGSRYAAGVTMPAHEHNGVSKYWTE